MQRDTQKLENVKTTILSLLLSRKRGSTLRQLCLDYCDIEGSQIPWKEFGYVSLLSFLYSMSQNIMIEHKANGITLRGIPSDRSKHVSKLVDGQKDAVNSVGRKYFKPSHYYPKTAPPRIHIPPEILCWAIELVNSCPQGVQKDYLLKEIQSRIPHANVKMQDMEEQFRELSHKLYLTSNKVYSNQKKTKASNEQWEYVSRSCNELEINPTIITAAGNEDMDDLLYYDDENDFKFVPKSLDSENSAKYNQSTSNFIQQTVSRYGTKVIEPTTEKTHLDNENVKDNVQMECNNKQQKDHENNENCEMLINERVKFRLEKLIQSHPDGIWCAELPDVYLQEYQISLNYTELGFNSVREFASQLPEIFHCVQPHGTGDFKLYYTKGKIPTIPVKETRKSTTSLAELHHIYDVDEPLPASVSIDICKGLIPEDTMSIGECVGFLNVTHLIEHEIPYVEVIVVEVFTPSFFWIQLRQKQNAFQKFMNELNNFYSLKYEQYAIPPLVLEKGLNCACIYNGKWHRGIIKAVKPDLQVIVMFYDYGTLKTYSSNAVYYLHRVFSHLPAQAIPCGLVNTRPYKAAKWTRSATHHFALRTVMPLIATIASINEEDNSMMVTLTDTSEEEDVHINDWLVEQKLAEHGKMVCTKYRNFPFRYYLECRERSKQTFEISSVRNKDNSIPSSVPSENCSQNKLLHDTNLKAKSIGEGSDNKIKISKARAGLIPSSGRKKLEFLRSCSYLKNNVSAKNAHNNALNSENKSPNKINSQYDRLLKFKQLLRSNDSDSNKEFNNNESFNESNERKEYKRSSETRDPNLRSNNISDTSTIPTINNNNKASEVSATKYEILAKYRNIPKSYANHFSIQDPENDLDFNCIKSVNRYDEPVEIEDVDWSTLCKDTPRKVESVPHQNESKITFESTLRKKDVPLADPCFLKAVYNSSYFAVNDKDIRWTPDGNIEKKDQVPTALLQNIRCCLTYEPKNIPIAIPQTILDKLAIRESSIESPSTSSIESPTAAPKDMNKVQCAALLEEASSVTADNEIANTKNSKNDLESHEENYYCLAKALPSRHNLLAKVLAIQNTNGTLELDSDDDSNTNFNVENHLKNNASTLMNNETTSIDSSVEMNLEKRSESDSTNTNIGKIVVDNESELQNEEQPLIEEIVPLEASVAENNIEETKELISFERMIRNTRTTGTLLLEESASSTETEKVSDQIAIKEIKCRELESVNELMSSEVVEKTSDIPVFNDLDLESDEEQEEWDVHVSFADICQIFGNNPFIKNIENQSINKPNSSLQITEIDDKK